MFNQFINKIPETHFGLRSTSILKENVSEKILLIYSKRLEDNESLAKIKELLSENQIEEIIFIKNNLEEIEKLEIKKPSLIIAIGGGNIMDFAKLLRIKIDNQELNLTEINNFSKIKKKTKLILIPTTPSTGSQITPVAITHNKEKSIKHIIVNRANIPNKAILAPQLLSSIPFNLMQEFICDIFSHSVEAYLSRLSNEFVKILARENILSLVNNYKKYIENKEDLKVLDNIAINGHIGGICQGNAYVGAMHSIAHQIEVCSNIRHSEALMHLIKSVLLFYKNETQNEIYDFFIQEFDKLNIKFDKSILENIDREEIIKRVLKDPVIKTSPIIFNEEKIRSLIEWIWTKK